MLLYLFRSAPLNIRAAKESGLREKRSIEVGEMEWMKKEARWRLSMRILQFTEVGNLQ